MLPRGLSGGEGVTVSSLPSTMLVSWSMMVCVKGGLNTPWAQINKQTSVYMFISGWKAQCRSGPTWLPVNTLLADVDRCHSAITYWNKYSVEELKESCFSHCTITLAV
jgi:hypothetical protein